MKEILIAEDDRAFGPVLKRELENGYRTTLVQDGVEAVLKVVENKYDFILLDIKMPNLDGINALRIIKKIRPQMPIITFSGIAGSGEMASSIKAGAIRCLSKPFSIGQLKEEIKKFIGE